MPDEIRLYFVDALPIRRSVGSDPLRVHGRFLPLQQHSGASIWRYRCINIQWIYPGRYAAGNATLSRGGGDCRGDLPLPGYHQPLPRDPEDLEQPTEQLNITGPS